MRILVTNDDGVLSPGIAALAGALLDEGHDVTVVAPLEDRSGTGAGIGPVHLGGGFGYEEVALPGLEEVPVYGIDSMPAMAVIAGALGGFGDPPDLVASGINLGLNTGRAVLHSGTVGAALTASHFAISALAVSLEAADTLHWDSAASIAALIIPELAAAAEGTVINLNVPNRPLADVLGVRRARLSATGSIQSTIIEADGRIQLEFGPPRSQPRPDGDVALVASGYATVTPISGVGEESHAQAALVSERLVSTWPAEGIA